MSPRTHISDDDLAKGLFAMLLAIYSKPAFEEICTECEFRFADRQSFCDAMFEWLVYGVHTIDLGLRQFGVGVESIPALKRNLYASLCAGRSEHSDPMVIEELAESSLGDYESAETTHVLPSLAVYKIFDRPHGALDVDSEKVAILRSELEAKMEQTFQVISNAFRRPIAASARVGR